MGVWVVVEVEWFEGREGVDCCEDLLVGENMRGDIGGNDEAILCSC